MNSKKKTAVGVTREFGEALDRLVRHAKEDLEETMGDGPTAEVMACLKVARLLEMEAKWLHGLVEPVVIGFNGKNCR